MRDNFNCNNNLTPPGIDTMVLEDQRFIQEDLERLEQAIADRIVEEPRNVRALIHHRHF